MVERSPAQEMRGNKGSSYQSWRAVIGPITEYESPNAADTGREVASVFLQEATEFDRMTILHGKRPP